MASCRLARMAGCRQILGDREGDMLAALNPADCAYSSLTVSVQKKNVEMLSRLLHNALCALFGQAWERYGIVSACAYGWLSLNSGRTGKGICTAALHPAGVMMYFRGFKC